MSPARGCAAQRVVRRPAPARAACPSSARPSLPIGHDHPGRVRPAGSRARGRAGVRARRGWCGAARRSGRSGTGRAAPTEARLLSTGPPWPPWVSSSGQTAMISASSASPRGPPAAPAPAAARPVQPGGAGPRRTRLGGARPETPRGSTTRRDRRSDPGIRARDILKRDITQKPPVQQIRVLRDIPVVADVSDDDLNSARPDSASRLGRANWGEGMPKCRELVHHARPISRPGEIRASVGRLPLHVDSVAALPPLSHSSLRAPSPSVPHRRVPRVHSRSPRCPAIPTPAPGSDRRHSITLLVPRGGRPYRISVGAHPFRRRRRGPAGSTGSTRAPRAPPRAHCSPAAPAAAGPCGSPPTAPTPTWTPCSPPPTRPATT